MSVDNLEIKFIIKLSNLQKIRNNIGSQKGVVRMHSGENKMILKISYDRSYPTEVKKGTDGEVYTTGSDDGKIVYQVMKISLL